MQGTLYRYPHPFDSSRFIYVGQGPKRDGEHRTGKIGFGRRFKKKFPGAELPQPIKEQIEVSNQQELNEEETIWMFRYRTWWGYPDGENLCLPGLEDYRAAGNIGGPITGRRNVESGQIQKLGFIQGKRNVESGLFSFEFQSKAGKVGGKIAGRKNAES